jgi:HK97 gp10 family phage protein
MADVEFTMDPDAFLHLERLAAMAAEDAAEGIADDAERLAPKDTGRMATSIEAHGDEVHVGTDHWQFVEYGTRYMDAEPFMRPATYKHRELRRVYP